MSRGSKIMSGILGATPVILTMKERADLDLLVRPTRTSTVCGSGPASCFGCGRHGEPLMQDRDMSLSSA
jgi:hypothetical protein